MGELVVFFGLFVVFVLFDDCFVVDFGVLYVVVMWYEVDYVCVEFFGEFFDYFVFVIDFV